MKLLFDENLSFKLSVRMQDVFPGSQHVRELGLEQVNDIDIWSFAKREGYVIVTKDADFNDLSVMYGFPPHIVWLRTGNVRVVQVENVLRIHQESIEKSVRDGIFGMIELCR